MVLPAHGKHRATPSTDLADNFIIAPSTTSTTNDTTTKPNNGWPATDPQYRYGLRAIHYGHGRLAILDQDRLPFSAELVPIENVPDACAAINSMAVRGAPAIAIVAALSIAIQLQQWSMAMVYERDAGATAAAAAETFRTHLRTVPALCRDLRATRPTAVNLANAMAELEVLAADPCLEDEGPATETASLKVMARVVVRAEAMLAEDVRDNRRIGEFGRDCILARMHFPEFDPKVRVLTHCNTGALATAGYGTALGIVRALAAHTQGQLECFFTESRPRFQGARLTAMELVYERIPCRMVADSAAAALLASAKGTVHAVVVGADRITREGAVANKIGTLGLAVLARHFGVPFIVAATTATIDLMSSAEDVRIEERDAQEMMAVRGPVLGEVKVVEGQQYEREAVVSAKQKGDQPLTLTCNPRVSVWNPAFDITPPGLIDVIVTEAGAFERPFGALGFNMEAIVKAAAAAKKR